jgi:hypothetical protein
MIRFVLRPSSEVFDIAGSALEAGTLGAVDGQRHQDGDLVLFRHIEVCDLYEVHVPAIERLRRTSEEFGERTDLEEASVVALQCSQTLRVFAVVVLEERDRILGFGEDPAPARGARLVWTDRGSHGRRGRTQ